MTLTADNRLICRHRWMSLCVGEFDEPYIACAAGVFVVPLTATGEVLFIREPAIPDGQPLLILPGGVVDPGESPAQAANRELQEEIGYKAGQMDFLAILNPLGKHADWALHCYLGRDLVASQLTGDEAYPITVEAHPLADLEQLIASGELSAAPVIAMLYMARALIARDR